MSFCVYQTMSGAMGIGSGVLRGPIRASRASKGLDSFEPKGSLWFLSLDRSVGVLGAWPLYIGRPCPLTKGILIQTGWLTYWVWRF